MNEKKRKAGTHKNRRVIIGVLFIVLIISLGAIVATSFFGQKNNVDTKESEKKTITLTMLGDIVPHDTCVRSYKVSDPEDYDFTSVFSDIKSYVEGADMAVCTLEAALNGPPYKGYPLFSAPSGLVKTLKETGFDITVTSSNHSFDNGEQGIFNTEKKFKELGMLSGGVRETTEEPRYETFNTNGVNVALASYTYASGPTGQRALNGIPVSNKCQDLINNFNPDNLGDAIEVIKKDCADAKAAGAEVLMVSFHWGHEYQTNSHKYQQELAKLVTDNTDVDIIFASHPHAPQEQEVMDSQLTGKKVPVYYSLGNLFSDQRRESVYNKSFVEEGVILEAKLVYDKEKKQTVKMDLRPTAFWVDKTGKLYNSDFKIVPLNEIYKENEYLKNSGNMSKADNALESVNEILGLETNKWHNIFDKTKE